MNDQYCLYCCLEKNRTGGCEFCGPDATGQDVETHPLYLTPGTILENKYLIGRVLGHGGFGITYLGLDLNLQMRVAIKEHLPRELATRHQDRSTVIPYSGQATDSFIYGMNKFIEEGRTLARFADHPNIVSVMNFFEANDTAYLVMLYLEGSNLQESLKNKGGRLPEAEAVQMMTMVLDGLRAVHGADLLHRDIKPANIFLTRHGSIRLVDFGSARRAMGEHSLTLSKIVSEGYSPFEQYTQGIKEGPWTDIYAVSATLYRLLSGRQPQPASERIIDDKLQRLSELVSGNVSQIISATVAKGLSIRADDRYQSVEEMLEALSGAKSAESSYEKDIISTNVSTGMDSAEQADGANEIDINANVIENLNGGLKTLGDEPDKAMSADSFPGFQKHEASEAKSQQRKSDANKESLGVSGRKCVTIDDVDQNSMKQLPWRIVERYKIIPMASTDNWMKLAMADPDNIVALDDIKFISGVSKIEVVPATEDSIVSTLRNYGKHSTPVAEPVKKQNPNVIRSGSAKLRRRENRWKKPLGWSLAVLVLISFIVIVVSYGTDKKKSDSQPMFHSKSKVKLPSKKSNFRKPAASKQASGKTTTTFNMKKGKFTSGKVTVPNSDKTAACAKAKSTIVEYTDLLCKGQYSSGKCTCASNTENTGKWKCTQTWKCNANADLSKQNVAELSKKLFSK